MRRRDFVAGAAGIVAGLPIRVLAEPPMPVVGFLHSSSPEQLSGMVEAFRQGLRSTGYSEDRNVRIEFRWAEDRNDLLPAMAADLVRRQVAVVVANSLATQAAKSATATIPIVFMTGGDPVKTHLVAGLARPGGNITGVSAFDHTLEPKKLEFLHELIPPGIAIAALVNPNNLDRDAQLDGLRTAAEALDRRLVVVEASREGNFAAAFDSLAQQGIKALLVAGDPLFNGRRRALIALAARHSIPAIYTGRQNAQDGGLLSYGSDRRQAYRDVGVYVGRILNGAKPADLPVMRPMRTELVINLRTAKTLGLDVPLALLDRADEVIE